MPVFDGRESSSSELLEGLDEDRGSFAATDTRGAHGVPAAASTELQRCREHESCPGHPDWVAEGYRSSIYVQLCMGNLDFFCHNHRYDGEGFVDLEEIDVGH